MRFIDTLVYQYRRWRYRSKPTPRIRVHARRSVPGWVVRILAALCSSVCVGLAAGHSPMPVGLIVALGVGLGLWMLVRPGYEVAMMSILMTGLLLIGSSHPHFDPIVSWICVASYLSLRLSMVSCLVTWMSWVELRALFTWRDACVAGLSVLIGCVALIPGLGRPAVVVGVVGILVVAVALRLFASTPPRSRYTGRG